MRKLESVIVIALILFSCSVKESNDFSSSNKEAATDIDVANKINELIRTDANGNVKWAENIYSEYNRLKSERVQARSQQELDWKDRGPGNVGGRMRNLLVDAADADGSTWVAASASGGIWKTVDSGVTWSNQTPDLAFLSFVSLAQSQSNTDVMYAGSGEGALGGSFINGVGVFKSIDGGDTWTYLESTSPDNGSDFQNTNRILVDPADENVVLAATSNGVNGQAFTSAIMKSTDGGATWSKLYEANSRVQQIATDPGDFNTIYASLIFRGIFKSTDGGATFTQTELADVVSSVGGSAERTEFAIAPSNPLFMYASVGYEARSGSGLFLSKDKGDTWIHVDDVATPTDDYLQQGEYDNAIAIDPFDHLKVYWGGISLYTAEVNASTQVNAGRGFTSLVEEDTESFLSFVSFDNGSQAGGRLAINDVANTPSIEMRFGPGLSQKAHRFTVPAGSTSGVPDADYTYQDYVDVPFEVWDIDANKQLMVSFRDQSNDGAFNLNDRDLSDDDLSDNREYIFIHSVDYAETPANSLTVDGGQEVSQYVFFWPTLTVGETWDPANLPASKLIIRFGDIIYQKGEISALSSGVHPDHHFLATVTTGTNSFRLITANDGGVAYSDDRGNTWVTVERGLNTSQFYAVTKKPGENIYFGGTQDNGVLLSPLSAGGLSPYTEQDAGVFADGFDVVWSQINPSRILASNQRNNIFRSLDGGQTWEFAIDGLTDAGFQNTNAPFYTKIANNPASNKVYAISGSGVWSSIWANTWTLVDMSGFDGWGGFLDIEVSPINSNIVWAGGGMSDTRDIFVSTDEGATFSAVGKYSESIGSITSIVPDPNDENTAYLLFSITESPKILKTTDLGQTWTDISGFTAGNPVSDRGFPNVATLSLLVFPDGQRLWAGTELGLVESMDGGASWSLLDSSLPSVLVWDMNVFDGEVVLATHGRGIWTVDLDLNYENSQPVPTGVADGLAVDVYPNPASEIANIRLDGEPFRGELRFYTIGGSLVESFDVLDGNVDLKSLDNGTYLLVGTGTNEEVFKSKLVVTK